MLYFDTKSTLKGSEKKMKCDDVVIVLSIPENSIIPKELLDIMLGDTIEVDEKIKDSINGDYYVIDMSWTEGRLKKENPKYYEEWLELKKTHGNEICKMKIPRNDCLPL